MNRDLERQLGEMGGDYRAVVDRLRRAAEVEPRAGRAGGPKTVCVTFGGGRRAGWLVAASLALAAGLGAIFLAQTPRVPCVTPVPAADGRRPTKAEGSSEYRLAHLRTAAAVAEMIRTQRADGGWRNDFLTRQNAAALKLCDSREAKIAYKKAMRNLRVKGIL